MPVTVEQVSHFRSQEVSTGIAALADGVNPACRGTEHAPGVDFPFFVTPTDEHGTAVILYEYPILKVPMMPTIDARPLWR